MRFSPKTIGAASAVITVVIWTSFIVIARATADPSRGGASAFEGLADPGSDQVATPGDPPETT